MAFRRRYRRRARRTGKVYKGITRYPRRFNRNIPRALNINIGKHFFKRTACVLSGTVNSSVAGGTGIALSQSADGWDFNTGTTASVGYFSWAMYFTLGMLPTYGDFSALFDQYKINKVKVKITPYSCSSILQTGVGAANNQAGAVIIHSVIDYDDATQFGANTAGIDQMRQYPSYRTNNFFQMGKPIKRYFTPHIAQAAYGSGVFASYANVGPRWIDMASTDVQHYGLKFIAETFQPDTSVPMFVWFKMEATLYLTCKNPR